MREKLSQSLIAKLPAPASGNVVTWDSEVTGLGIRVTAGGAKSFVLNYRHAGTERRLTIGRFPDWDVTAARTEAKALLRKVDRGDDPLAKRQGDRNAVTVADLVERYVDEHLPTKRPSSQQQDRRMISATVLPKLGRLKVADVSFADISALHREISKSAKTEANRVLALLSKMFALAVIWQHRTDNPCKGIKRNAEHGRESFLEHEEIGRLMKALAKHDDREAANAIMLDLLTGARRGELLRATWDQFDLAKGVWIKPSAHTKSNRTHRVPLSAAAVQLLKAMKADSTGKGSLFPSCIKGGDRVDVRRPWQRVCEAAGLDGVRFHDLRHSYASLLVSSGLSLPVIGRLLGHTQPSTTARYAHLLDDPLREATERVGKLVSKA